MLDPHGLTNMELGLAYVDINSATEPFLLDLGVTALYNSVRWCNVQPQNHAEFNWSVYDFEFSEEQRLGITSVRSISHTPAWLARASEYSYWTSPPTEMRHWSEFIRKLVERYPGRTWTIWAEPDNYPPRESPNLVCFTGSAEEYGEMLKTAYAAAKNADPSCRIGVGGLVGATINGSFPYQVFDGQPENRLVFLETLIKKNFLQYADFVGLDSYGFGYGGVQNIRNGISLIRKMTRRKPMMILETGAKLTRTDKIDPEKYKHQYGHEPVTQETVAGLLLSVAKMASDFEIEKVFWLTLMDSDWGLINRRGGKHLAYPLFKQLKKHPSMVND